MVCRSIVCFLLLAAFFACETPDNIIKDIEQAEYSRQLNHQEFVSWVNHEDPAVKLRAVEALGRVQDTSAILLLANRLTDDNPDIRSAAVFGLGQLGLSRAESFLLSGLRLESDNRIRAQIIEALGKIGTDKNYLIFRDFLQSTHPEYQEVASLAHGHLGLRGIMPPGTNIEILGLMMKRSDYAGVSWRCAYSIYAIGSVRSFNDLREGLQSNYEMTRFYCLKGLERIARTTETDEFKTYLRENRGDRNIRRIIDAADSRQYRQELIAALHDSIWFVQVAAIEAAQALGHQDLQTEVAKLVKAVNPSVAIMAIRALPDFQLWYARRELRRIYADESFDWQLRGEALAALALVRPAEALQHVENDWLNRSWPETYYAIQTLRNIETSDESKPLAIADDATRLLMQLAESDLAAQRTLSVEALVKRVKPPVSEFFVEQLKSGDKTIAAFVSLFIATPGAPRPEEVTELLLDIAETLEVPAELEPMRAILVALDSLGSEKALPILSETLSSNQQVLRETAARALERFYPDSSFAQTGITTSGHKSDFKPLSTDSTYTLTLETTGGEVKIELYSDTAPISSASIVDLTRKGFYKNMRFHHIIPGNLIQTGEPRGDGWGHPGYTIPCEYNDVPVERGSVGIANAGKDTGSSQFFISATPQPHLYGKHTMIGKVTSGMGIVDKLLPYDELKNMRLSVSAK